LAEQTELMLKLGIMLTAATVTILIAEFFRTWRRPLPAHGWLGLIALLCAEFSSMHSTQLVQKGWIRINPWERRMEGQENSHP
jgi:hypothetical protein